MAKLVETEACDLKCPLRRTLAVIEGKYTPLILKALFAGTKRFGQLRRNIQGISPKTLSDKLKDLTDKGVVERISYPEVPPKVEYRLTSHGERMKGVVQQLQEFWQEEANTQGDAGLSPTKAKNDLSAAQILLIKKPIKRRPLLPAERTHLLSQNQMDVR
jgi:DNA-binding HxlR family transcriptional regulator